jgi:2-keto-4-pentenoate hydratase
LARRQWRDYQWGTPGTMFSDPEISLTLDEAYKIQMEFAGLRCAAGDAVAGYKVGCIGSGVVEQFGMSGPIHARLFRSEIHSSGETLRYQAYANPAIEGEMALRIGVDGGIAAAFPVIELHQFVFRAARKTLAELVANNGINAGAVIPQHLEAASLQNWADARTLSISINGVSVETGALWAMAGGAAEALEWLHGDLRRFCEVLKPGDLVLAGTPLGLHPVQEGDHVVVSIDGKDCVDCRFE